MGQQCVQQVIFLVTLHSYQPITSISSSAQNGRLWTDNCTKLNVGFTALTHCKVCGSWGHTGAHTWPSNLSLSDLLKHNETKGDSFLDCITTLIRHGVTTIRWNQDSLWQWWHMISLSKFKQFSDHYISTLTNLKVFISRLKPEKKTIIPLQYKIHTSLKIKDHIGNFTRTIVSHSVPSNFHLSGPMKDGSDETVITAVKRKKVISIVTKKQKETVLWLTVAFLLFKPKINIEGTVKGKGFLIVWHAGSDTLLAKMHS